MHRIGYVLPLLTVLGSCIGLVMPTSVPHIDSVDCSTLIQSYTTSPLEINNLARISPQNANQLTQLRQVGRGPINAIALSPDQETVAVATSIGVWLYSSNSISEPVRFLCGHSASVNDVAFNDDGTVLGTASDDNTARLWDVQTGNTIRILRGHNNEVTHIAFNSSQNAVVTGSSDETVRIWDLSSGEELHRLESSVQGVAGGINALAISPNGEQLVFASSSGGGDYVPQSAIQLWNFGKESLTNLEIANETYGNTTTHIKFSPHSTKLGLLQGQLLVIDISNGKQVASFSGNNGYINNFVWSSNSTSLILSTVKSDTDNNSYTSIEQVNIVSGEHQILIDSQNGSITPLSYQDRQVLLLSTENSVNYHVEEWDIAEDTTFEFVWPLFRLENHTQATSSVSISPDNEFIAIGGYGRAVIVYELDTLHQAHILSNHGISVNRIAFHPDSSLLATIDQLGVMRLWDIESGDLLKTETVITNDIGWSVAFSYDGTLLAGSGGLISDRGVIRLWDIPSGTTHVSLNRADAQAIAFSPDGNALVSGGSTNNGIIQFWDIRTGQLTSGLQSENGWILGIAYSPDGNLLATITSDNTTQLWDLTTRQRIAVLGQPSGHNTRGDVAFNPDGNILVSTHQDYVVVWDVAMRTESFRLNSHLRRVQQIAFSADGRLIATGGDDSTVRLWGIVP